MLAASRRKFGRRASIARLASRTWVSSAALASPAACSTSAPSGAEIAQAVQRHLTRVRSAAAREREQSGADRRGIFAADPHEQIVRGPAHVAVAVAERFVERTRGAEIEIVTAKQSQRVSRAESRARRGIRQHSVKRGYDSRVMRRGERGGLGRVAAHRLAFGAEASHESPDAGRAQASCRTSGNLRNRAELRGRVGGLERGCDFISVGCETHAASAMSRIRLLRSPRPRMKLRPSP